MSDEKDYTIPPEEILEFRSQRPSLLGRVKLRDGRPHLALVQNGAAWVDIDSLPDVIRLLKQMAEYVGKSQGKPDLWRQVVQGTKAPDTKIVTGSKVPVTEWTKAAESVATAQAFIDNYGRHMTPEERLVAENILQNAKKAAVNLVKPGSQLAVNWEELTRYSSSELYAFLRRNAEKISEGEQKEIKKLIKSRLDFEKTLKGENTGVGSSE